MKSLLTSAPSLVLALVVGSSAFAPAPHGPGPCSTVCDGSLRRVGCRGSRRSLGPTCAKPQPRKGEREGDFEPDDSGILHVSVLFPFPIMVDRPASHDVLEARELVVIVV